ncbi:MAG TPA: phosphate ABC transporter substrate-binding protein PstS, partial [Candidatus Babeliaceae bacterium]|nr:phosphate ABC transporter substrate-binding protein PstS [Candidatus Babeliaceae bacterium]
AGSSFDNPLFSKMFSQYDQQNGVKVNYQSIGSGAGIQQLISHTVDFGASDAPMNPKQDSSAGAAVLNIPITCGAVVVSYNLPDIKDTLMFTPSVLADIFLGNIKQWDDPKIAAINKGVKLPSIPIVVAHRSDGSGTSAIFTSYLSKVSDEWKTKVGTGTSVNWPTGVGGKGNEGVAGVVKQTPGGIGYNELAYALQNKMQYGKMQNKSGNYIVPTIASTSSSANVQLPADGKVWITDTDAPDGYPISGFSWVLVYKEQKYGSHTQAKATNMLKLIEWMIHDGQQYGADLSYAPLPDAAVTVGDNLLKSVTFDGKPILQ